MEKRVIEHVCPSCGGALRIPIEYAGQDGRCRKCNAPIVVPKLAALHSGVAGVGDNDSPISIENVNIDIDKKPPPAVRGLHVLTVKQEGSSGSPSGASDWRATLKAGGAALTILGFLTMCLVLLPPVLRGSDLTLASQPGSTMLYFGIGMSVIGLALARPKRSIGGKNGEKSAPVVSPNPNSETSCSTEGRVHWNDTDDYVRALVKITGAAIPGQETGLEYNKELVRTLGEEINAKFGFEGMQNVWHHIRASKGPTATSDLNRIWDRIGQWQH